MYPSSTRRAVTVARLLYLIISIVASVMITFLVNNSKTDHIWLGIVIGTAIGAAFIYIESLAKQFSIRGFSTATFGLCIGLFCAWLLQSVNLPALLINLLASDFFKIDRSEIDLPSIRLGFDFILFSSLGYLGTVLALRTNQDDFSIVIPFIRFRQENLKGRPVVCSLDALIDGRLPELIQSGFVNQNVILPQFVADELQALASSPSSTKNLQGQRGLDTLDKLRKSQDSSLTIHKFDTEQKNESHDSQTMLTCKQLDSRLLTCDDNLTEIAKLQDVKVLNLKTLAEAMKPRVEVGQRLSIAIVRTGKEEHQGVGYLPDGTMIVVNNGVKLIGSSQDVTVISTIQTTAGLMVFTELDEAA